MPLRVLLHAPTAGALERGRANARNLQRARPDAEILLIAIANADAVAAALATPDADTNDCLRLCANTLRNRQLHNHRGLAEVAAAVETLALLQTEGWCYIRA